MLGSVSFTVRILFCSYDSALSSKLTWSGSLTYYGQVDEVERLLKEGAIPNAIGPEQATALMAASINGNLNIVKKH